MNLRTIAGLAGVAPKENPKVRKWASRLEWPMLSIACWIPVQWYLENNGILKGRDAVFGDWLIWLFFVAETLLLTRLATDRLGHLKRNWMNLAIIAAGLPIVWNVTPLAGALRGLRLLLITGLLLRVSRTVTAVLTVNSLGTTMMVSFAILVLSGVIISTIDPGIGSAADGIWWAWVTVTTVGYGDIVPTTPAGKLFASLLILLGIGLFSLLTANISAFLIGRDVRKDEAEMRGRLRDIQDRLERMERQMEHRSATDKPAGPGPKQ